MEAKPFTTFSTNVEEGHVMGQLNTEQDKYCKKYTSVNRGSYDFAPTIQKHEERLNLSSDVIWNAELQTNFLVRRRNGNVIDGT